MANENPVAKSFADTTKLLFGQTLSGIEKYEAWLFEHVPKLRVIKMQDTQTKLLKSTYGPNSFFYSIPEDKAISWQSFDKAGNRKITEIVTDFHALGKKAGEIALFCCEYKEGKSANNLGSNDFLNLTNSYNSVGCFFARNCGCALYSSFSEGAFGSFLALHSRFVINCYFSTKLSSCFECDACHNCSNSMFCHNCENVNDSLFCFNVKNLRYAVGNQVVGKEEYLRIRGILCSNILESLEKKKKFDLSIYNIGCRKN